MKLVKKVALFLSTAFVFGALGALAACGERQSSSQSSTQSSSATSSSSASEEETYIYPADNFSDWATPLSGDGSEYNRFECTEGYYQIQVPANGEVFYSFSVRSDGQYALYSLDSASGVTVMRYDASTDYIPMDDNGRYVGEQADETDGNNFYSRLNCSAKHFTSQWRATYGFKAEQATTVKVRFVWIDEALPEPKTIETKITAKEIVGVAENGEAGKTAIVVPYASEYFYDKDCELAFTPIGGGEPVYKKGFYRLGTPENKGAVIYVAITSIPERMFDKTFATIQYDGNNLSLQTGTADNGDYLMNNYVDFIMNNGGVVDNANGGVPVEGDPTKLCYENVVNDDGLFPVNQELFEFLNYYVRKNTVPSIDETVAKSAHWLAPCYYYAQVEMGTKAHPLPLQTGDTEIVIEENGYTYCAIAENGTFTLSCNTEKASVVVNGIRYDAPFAIHVEKEAVEEVVVGFPSASPAQGTLILTLAKAQGTQGNPLSLTIGTVQATPLKILTENGVKYSVCYAFTATTDGTLTLTLPHSVQAECLEKISENGTLTLTVSAGGTYVIVCTAENHTTFTLETTYENA